MRIGPRVRITISPCVLSESPSMHMPAQNDRPNLQIFDSRFLNWERQTQSCRYCTPPDEADS